MSGSLSRTPSTPLLESNNLGTLKDELLEFLRKDR